MARHRPRSRCHCRTLAPNPGPEPLPLHCQASRHRCPRVLCSSCPSSSSSLRSCSGKRSRLALMARYVHVLKKKSPCPSPLHLIGSNNAQHNSHLRQGLVIEGGKVLPSPTSPSRKSMAAQPKVNEGPDTGPSLSSRRPWRCVEFGHGLPASATCAERALVHPGAPSTPRLGRRQVSDASACGNGLKPQRQRGSTRVISMQ